LTTLIRQLNPLALIIIISIILILFTAFVATILLRKKYKDIYYDLNDKENRDIALFDSKVLNYIIDDYKIAALNKRKSEINTQAIIEKNFNSELSSLYFGERFIKKAVSLMIILGLLGTFYGLTLSIGRLVELLSSSNNLDVLDSMDSVVVGLINSVKGMSVAFTTSLFGISSSIILTIVNIFFGVEEVRESVMIEIEEYLDNTLSKDLPDEIDSPEAMVSNELSKTLEKFGDKLETSIKEITDIFSYRFTAAASGIEKFSDNLQNSVIMFNKSLENFSDNVRDFSEFNHHLKNNIQRMSISFNDFTEDLKENSKRVSEGYDRLDELNKSIQNLTEKVDSTKL